LRDFFFGPHSAVALVTRKRFDPAKEHPHSFPPAAIALVATAACISLLSYWEILTKLQVCVALDEWRTGQHLAVLFSCNHYTDIYNNHIILLKNIMEKNPSGYHHLLRQLYISAS
jgi:hypothetical protein